MQKSKNIGSMLNECVYYRNIYTYFHTSASNIFVQRKFYAQVLLTSECKTRFYDNILAHALIY